MSQQGLFLDDLEQRHSSLRVEYEALSAERDSLKVKTSGMQAHLEELRQQIELAARREAELGLELKQKDANVSELSLFHEELQDRFKRRSEECDRLREDIKTQSAELVSLQARLRDSQAKLSEVQSKELPTQFELTKIAHERDSLQKKVVLLEEELQKRLKEERVVRSDLNDKQYQLERMTKDREADAEQHRLEVSSLQDQLKLQQEKSDVYLQKLQEAETAQVKQSGTFSEENESLKRLVDLYKRYFEEATNKVEELESASAVKEEANAKAIASLKQRFSLQLEQCEKLHDADKRELSVRVSDLESELSDLRAQGAGKPVTIPSAGPIVSVESFEGIGITEIYDKVVSAERELAIERGKRKEVELYMSQILKDVESKAPLIANQRRDYQRIVESHNKLTQKLDQYALENTDLRENLKTMQKRTEQAVQEMNALEQHNKDLGSQVQHLLKHQMRAEFDHYGQSNVQLIGYDDSATNVISEHLVTFDNIADLQVRNEQLLKVVRKLSQEQEAQSQQVVSSKADPSSDFNELSQALQAALTELADMRESRKRTEDLVKGLVQQRDMYRAMLEEADNTVSGNRDSFGSSGIQSPSKLLTASETSSAGKSLSNNATQSTVRELQAKIGTLEDEKRRALDRLSRLEDAEKLLSESLDKARSDASNLRMETAQANSEARFQGERADRLEASLGTLQLESNLSLQRRLELERTMVDMQKELRIREEKLVISTDELRSTQEILRRLEVDLELAKAAEARLINQLADAREEVKRQSNLGEHLQRIESGLKGRLEEEKESLAQERDTLAKSYDLLRKQMDERSLIEEQRLKNAEDEIRTLRTKHDHRAGELSSLQEELVREQSAAKAAQEKCSILEKQLGIAQDRLASLQGSAIVETFLQNDGAAKSAELERALAEVESLKAQLVKAEEHTEQFRKISVAAESTLKDLRTRSAESKAVHEKEVEEARQALENAVKDFEDFKASSFNVYNEIDEAREKLRAAGVQHAEALRVVKEELTISKQQVDAYRQQMDTVRADISKFQQAAKSAYNNYERELQLHAAAEKELKESQAELEETKESLVIAQRSSAELSASIARQERVAVDERASLVAEAEILKQQLSDLRRTNELLHAQVQSYGVQIERLQDSKAPLITGQSNDMSSGANEPGAAFEELQELRKANSEMREVVRFMKREKDMLEAKLTVAETENNRHMNEISVLTSTLAEVRGDLKKELDKRVVVRSEEEFAKLVAEVTQLNLIRESNAHLRAENEELSTKIMRITDELTKSKAANVPLEEAIRKLKTEKEALELTNDELSNDVGYWKDRLQNLVSRYNEVDPEEHRLLKVNCDELTEKVSELQAQFDAKVKEFDDTVAAKTKELESLQSSYQNSVKSGDKLRSMLRDFKSKKEEVEAKFMELVQSNKELETQFTATNGQLQEVQSQNKTLAADLAKVKDDINGKNSSQTTPSSAGTVSTTSKSTFAIASGLPTVTSRPAVLPTSFVDSSSSVVQGSAASNMTTASTSLNPHFVDSTKGSSVDNNAAAEEEKRIEKQRKGLLLKRKLEAAKAAQQPDNKEVNTNLVDEKKTDEESNPAMKKGRLTDPVHPVPSDEQDSNLQVIAIDAGAPADPSHTDNSNLMDVQVVEQAEDSQFTQSISAVENSEAALETINNVIDEKKEDTATLTESDTSTGIKTVEESTLKSGESAPVKNFPVFGSKSSAVNPFASIAKTDGSKPTFGIFGTPSAPSTTAPSGFGYNTFATGPFGANPVGKVANSGIMFGKPPLPAGPPPSVDINPAATKSLEEGEDEDGEVHEEGPPQATIAPPTKNVFGLPNNTTFSGSSSVFGKGFLNPAAPLFTPKFGLVGSNPFAAAKSLLLGSSVPTAPGGSAEPTGAKTATSDQSNTDDEPQISNTTPAEEAIPSIINTQEVGEKPELSEIDASVEKLAPVSDAVPVAKSDEPVKAGETKSTENVPTDEEKASHGITGVTEVPLSTVSTSNTSTITPGKTVVIKSTAPSTGKQGSKDFAQAKALRLARFKLKKEEEAAAAAAGGTAKATADTASASAGTVNPAAQRKPKGKPAVKGPKAAGTQAQADGPAKQEPAAGDETKEGEQ